MTKRTWTDAPNVERCLQDVTLRDGSKAQCGRRAQTDSSYCWQHDPSVIDMAVRVWSARTVRTA